MMLSRLVTALVVAGALVLWWGNGAPALGAPSHGAENGGHGGGEIDPFS